MNKKCTWRETFEKTAYVKKAYSFQAFSDGGKRDTAHAAAAWVIFAISEGSCKEIGNGAVFLENKDSFQTETLAMEYAIRHIQFIVKERDKRSHSGMLQHPSGLNIPGAQLLATGESCITSTTGGSSWKRVREELLTEERVARSSLSSSTKLPCGSPCSVCPKKNED